MDRPNILIIMTDQQKATASHLYGNPNCETPHLAALAQQGVRYEHAFTPHPLCMPARASFWTGQYPHSHGSRRNETPLGSNPGHRVEHAAKIWYDAGYHLGLIGKNHCFEREEDLALFGTWCEISHGGLPADSEPRGMPWFRSRQGIDAAHEARRTMIAQNPRFGYAVTDHPLEDYSTGLVTGQTVRFLEQHQHEPFALWVSYPDPHEPWVVPRAYADLFPPDQIVLPPGRAQEFDDGTAPERNQILYRMLGVLEDDPDDLRRLMAVYYGMIRFIDDGVGEIVATLARLGLTEKTIVVFCSDHGDFMGEHAMQCKGGVFYDCLTRVPLIVAWPGTLPANQVDESMVNLIDVIPTLLHLQGLPIPRAMHGQPLPTVTPTAPRDAAFSEYGAGGPPFQMQDLLQLPRPFGRASLITSLRAREAEGRRKMVRTQRWKYVHDPMGDVDELYDLTTDPWELTNVVGDISNATILAEMRLRLADWSINSEDALAVPLP